MRQRERAWPPVIRPPRCLSRSNLVGASRPRERRKGSNLRDGGPQEGAKLSASAWSVAVRKGSASRAASFSQTPPRTPMGSIASRVATAMVAAVGKVAHSSELQVVGGSAARVVHVTAVGDEVVGPRQIWPPAGVRRKRHIASTRMCPEEETRWLGSSSKTLLRPRPSDLWSGRWEVLRSRWQRFKIPARVRP